MRDEPQGTDPPPSDQSEDLSGRVTHDHNWMRERIQSEVDIVLPPILLDRSTKTGVDLWPILRSHADIDVGVVMMNAETYTVGEDFVLCSTSKPCDACEQPLKTGERVYYLSHLATPWKAEDDEYNSWAGYVWHIGCDDGSLAAEGTG